MFEILFAFAIVEGILWAIVWGNYYGRPHKKKQMRNEDDYVEEYGQICSYFNSHPKK